MFESYWARKKRLKKEKEEEESEDDWDVLPSNERLSKWTDGVVSQEAINQPMNFCPDCGKQVKENAKYCHNCGNSLIGHVESKTPDEIKEPRESISERQETIDGIRCPLCGSKTTKRRVMSGVTFNVCMRYPNCKGRILADSEWD